MSDLVRQSRERREIEAPYGEWGPFAVMFFLIPGCWIFPSFTGEYESLKMENNYANSKIFLKIPRFSRFR